MNYIDVTDIEDDILKGVIQDTDLAYATKAVDDLFTQLGIDSSNYSVKTPLTGKVLDFAVAIACERRAKFSIGLGTHYVENGTDVYELKRRVYSAEAQRLRSSITPRDLTGSSDLGLYSPVIELYRG